MRRSLSSHPIQMAAGLVALGLVTQVGATTNLLVNPGFESPSDPGQNADTLCTGWTFQFDCERSTFHQSPPSNQWNIWAKTFEPLGGGVTQNVAIVGGSQYTLSTQNLFEAGYNQSQSTVQLGLIWLDSSNNPVGTPGALNIDPTSNPTPLTWLPYSLTATAPANATEVMVSLGWSGGTTVQGQSQSAFFDNADLEGAGTPPNTSAWVIDASGDWNSNGNWANGTVPNGVGVEADFLSAITSNHTVFTDIGVTVGTLNLNNAHTYVITGAGSLTLQATSGSAYVNVQAGTQKLNLPTVVASNTVLNVSPGATLLVSDPVTVNAGASLTQSGGGTVTYQSTISVLGSGGIAFANSTHAHELDIASGGTASIGGSGSVLTVDSLSNAGKVDVKKNALIVSYGNGADPSASILSQLKTGYANGAWNGNGINTSSASSHVGVGWKDDTTGKSVLVQAALYGDANLDGTVNSQDFALLAAKYGSTSATAIWNGGDFNYDGTVNALDFNALANNYGATLSQFLPASLPDALPGSLVPEPTSIAALATGAALLAMRRRRSC